MKLIPEWYEHQYCLIAWPCNYELFGKIISEAKRELLNVIKEIAKTEKVILLCNKADIDEVQKSIKIQNVEILECKLDDSWMRDIAPIFYNENSKLKSINFVFNAYLSYASYFFSLS